MAQFRFKYESVLRRRQIEEDECQRLLAKELRHRMIFRNQLISMQSTLSSSKHDMAQSLQGKVDMDDVTQFARYSGQVTARAQTIVHKLAAVEKRIEAAQKALSEAMRDRKAMELLRDRYKAEFKRQENRRQTLFLDEVAMQAYVRKLQETGT